MTTTQIIVLDTETTGMSPEEGSALLELAWVSLVARVDNPKEWVVANHDSYIIYHEGEIPPQARAVHHISPADVTKTSYNCFERDSVMHSLLSAREPGDIFCAHNARFDRQFLPELDEPWICTYRCAMHLWPEAPAHSNQVLRYWLGIEPDQAMLSGLAPHRALYDTAVTAAILQRMLITHSPQQLVGLTNMPVLLDTVRFGKHRGLKWSEVPRDYLDWLVRKSDMLRDDADLRHTVRHYLGLS